MNRLNQKNHIIIIGFFLMLISTINVSLIFGQENDDSNENGVGGSWESIDLEKLETPTAILASLATGGALIFLGYETMKLRNERNLTLRAWIGQEDPRIFLDGYLNANNDYIKKENWTTMSGEERDNFAVTRLRHYLIVKNFGQIPASDFKARTKVVIDRQPTKIDIQSKQFSSSSILMPGQTIELFYYLTLDEEKATLDKNRKSYLIWEIKYKSANSKTIRKLGTVAEISLGKYGIAESWGLEKDKWYNFRSKKNDK